MLVLGLVLVLVAIGAVVAMVFNGSDTELSLFDGHVHATALSVFIAGAATVLLVVLGLALMRLGARRARTNRQNTKRLRRLERNEAARRNQGPLSGKARTDNATQGRGPGRPSADPDGTSGGESGLPSADPDGPSAGQPGRPSADPRGTSTGEPGRTASGSGGAGSR